jgi:hypothetical protein
MGGRRGASLYEALRMRVAEQADATIAELRASVVHAHGVAVSRPVIWIPWLAWGLRVRPESHAGLQSFRSIRRIDASWRNASALRLRFSKSLARRRQRLSQAKVRSTTQRIGRTTKPFV